VPSEDSGDFSATIEATSGNNGVINNKSMTASDEGAGVKVGNYRWVIYTVLFFATTVNYVDRQVLSILKPTLQGEFGWSEISYGWIVFSFQTAYAIGLLFVGNLMDKIGTSELVCKYLYSYIGYVSETSGWFGRRHMRHGGRNRWYVYLSACGLDIREDGKLFSDFYYCRVCVFGCIVIDTSSCTKP